MPVEDPDVPVIRAAPTRSLDIALDRTPVRKLEFVDIDPTPVRSPRRRAAVAMDAGASAATLDDVGAAAASIDPGEPRWSLWGDAEV